MIKIATVEWQVESGAVTLGTQHLTIPFSAGTVRFTKRIDTRTFDGLWVDDDTIADLQSVLEAYLSAPIASGTLERHNRLGRILRQIRDHAVAPMDDW